MSMIHTSLILERQGNWSTAHHTLNGIILTFLPPM